MFKRILIYCPTFYPENSGFANAFLNFIKSLLYFDSNLHVTVITPKQLGDIPELKIDRLTICRLKQSPTIPLLGTILKLFFLILHGRFINKYFIRNNFNLFFVETLEHPFLLLFIDKNILRNTTVRFHGSSDTEHFVFLNSLKYFLKRKCVKYLLKRRLKWVLSTNTYYIDFIKKHYCDDNVLTYANLNFFVLPNTVHVSDNITIKNVDHNINFLMLGRMDSYGILQKGITDLILALKLLDKKYYRRINFTIIGSGDKMDFIKKSFSTINHLNVNFIERLENNDVAKLIQNNDIIILPSRYEGLSMFALEGIAYGNICIFSNSGGLTDLVDKNGFLFYPQDFYALSHIINLIFDLDNDQLMNMKIASLELFNNKFSPFVVYKKFSDLYHLVVG